MTAMLSPSAATPIWQRLLATMLEFDAPMPPDYLAREEREILKSGRSTIYDLTAWNLTTEVPSSWWLRFWRVWIWVFTGGALAVTIWFTVGGWFDLRYLFRHLESFVPDPGDDGRVTPDERGIRSSRDRSGG